MNLDANRSLISKLPFSDAVEDFILHQRTCRHSPRTIENHRLALGKLEKWAKRHGMDYLEDLDVMSLRRFFVDQQSEPLRHGQLPRPYTLFTTHKNVKAFFNFHELEENITRNPMRRVKPPKLDTEILPAFTSEEIKTLELATSGKDSISLRNRALIYFMLDSGCRLSEVAEMKITDIDLESGDIKVRLGKGGKDRMTRIGFAALKALKKYLRAREDGNPQLWVGVRGPMTVDGIGITLEKLGKKCGVHCHAHKFRRTMALTMLRQGCDVYSIKHLLGHSDLQVLQRYLAQTQADIARAHTLYSPLDHLHSSPSKTGKFG